MNFSEIIKTAVSLFPLTAIILTVPFSVGEIKKYRRISLLKTAVFYTFIFYILCAFLTTILPLPDPEYVKTLTGPEMQLMPFDFVRSFKKESGFSALHPSTYIRALTDFSFLQPVLNIALTVPFGCYMKYLFGASLRKTAVCTFLLSLFFELTQLSGLYFLYARPYRLFDIDDLFLNTLGGVVGFLFCKKIVKYLPVLNKEKRQKATLSTAENLKKA